MKTQTTRKITPLEEELSQFTGTENYYKSSFGMLNVTDGVHYLRTEGQCYWLIDIIESYQKKIAHKTPFQVWKLIVKDNKGLVTCEDGNYNLVIKQEIPYTDFEEKTGMKEIELYCTNGVVLLPSEY